MVTKWSQTALVNAIDRIIRYLMLTFAAEGPPPSQAQPQLAMAAEERAEYV